MFRSLPIYLLFALLAFSIPCPQLRADDETAEPSSYTADGRPIYTVPRIASEIRVDGALDEPAWENALVLELAYEVRPLENAPAPVRTEFLMTYDDRKVYVAFRAYDPDPSAVRARYRDHDSQGSDDWVGIILDTFNDERRNMQFLVTALGVQRDGVGSQSGEDYSWDGIWESAGKITDWGYAVELAIPYSTLRFQRADGPQVWGLDAVRSYSRDQLHHISLFPRDRNNNCYGCQMVKIRGFEGATPGRNIEINPTVTAVRTDERSDLPAGDFERANQDAEAGITAHWGITPSMIFSATANPDFSQVEADALQLDINQPFALYYQEKRPFFTEGANLFSTRLDASYTRTIRDPSWGFKLTGKEGPNTIGAYVVRDDLTNLIFPGSQSSRATSLAMGSTASVFRYKRDIWGNSTIGALFTDREGDDYFNRVFGFDGDFYLTRKDRVRVEVFGSSTRYPDDVVASFDQHRGSFSDKTIDIEYTHSTRNLLLIAGYLDRGRDFRADLGFVPQVDIRNPYLYLRYEWLGEQGDWWRYFRVSGRYNYYDDHDGNLVESLLQCWITYSGTMQSWVQFGGHVSRAAYNGVEFDLRHFSFFAECQPTGSFSFYVGSIFGDRIDYANTRQGKRLQLNPHFSYDFGRHLRFSFDHYFERMTVQEARLYTANISQLSAVYQLSTRMFFRAILQHVDYRYNPDNYAFEIDPEYRSFFSQLLFSYKLNPRTVLFIGYSDNYFGNQDFGLAQTDRTFFVKLGYAWVL